MGKKKAPAKKKAAPKAEAPKVNKSAEIRNYAKKHPKAKAKEIAEALAASGIDVSANAVYGVLRSSTPKTANAPHRRQTTKAAPALSTAIDFVKSAGGFDQAKALLEQLEQVKKL